jgi:hypothetical protein
MKDITLTLIPATDPIGISCGIINDYHGESNRNPHFQTCGFYASINGHEEEKAFARRIVACVNACQGIETETLESRPLSQELGTASAEMMRLRLENEELLLALSKISHAISDGIAPDDFKGWADFYQDTATNAVSYCVRSRMGLPGIIEQPEPEINGADYERDWDAANAPSPYDP